MDKCCIVDQDCDLAKDMVQFLVYAVDIKNFQAIEFLSKNMKEKEFQTNHVC